MTTQDKLIRKVIYITYGRREHVPMYDSDADTLVTAILLCDQFGVSIESVLNFTNKYRSRVVYIGKGSNDADTVIFSSRSTLH